MRWDDAKAGMGSTRSFGDSRNTWRIVRSSTSFYGKLELNGQQWDVSGPYVGTAVTTWLAELNNATTTYNVPLELLLAAMLNSGALVGGTTWTPTYTSTLAGYVDDASTPDRILCGLTGILLSQAQMVFDNPALTSTDLLDVQTNLNACAAMISYQAAQHKYDPVMVGACFNQAAIRGDPDPANSWRMLPLNDNPEWLDNWAADFSWALNDYPTLSGVTGPSFGDLIFYWVEEPPILTLRTSYYFTETTDAFAAGLTIVSTLSPQLNGVWPLTIDALAPMSSAAVIAYGGFGPDSFTFYQQDSTPAEMNRTELCRLYAACANYANALEVWDGHKEGGLPDVFNPFPSDTTTIP